MGMEDEAPFRVRTFWSPDRKLLMTVYVTEDDISVVDDNGDLYEPAGPEQNMSEAAAGLVP